MVDKIIKSQFAFDKKTWQKDLTSKLGRVIIGLQSKLGNTYGGLTMNKEEILEKSRKENDGDDLPAKEIYTKSYKVANSATEYLVILFFLLDSIVFKRPAYEFIAAVALGYSIQSIYNYVKAKDRTDLIIAIVFCIAAIVFIGLWILQIIGLI